MRSAEKSANMLTGGREQEDLSADKRRTGPKGVTNKVVEENVARLGPVFVQDVCPYTASARPNQFSDTGFFRTLLTLF